MTSRSRGALQHVADRDVVLREVYRAHFGELVLTARWLLDEHGLAEEVVQEAFARTYASWGRIRNRDDPLPYIRRSVVNLARSRLRRRGIERRTVSAPEPAVPSAEVDVVRAQDRQLVAAAVARLPRRQRECIVLRYVAEASVAEIAAELGFSEGAVKQHLHRAHEALGRALRDDPEEVTRP
jgi:RNA polymerase sigma-70 factor (sigma-E family)